MRNINKSSNKTSTCISCVHKTAQVLFNQFGIEKVRSVSHAEFYGYMALYSPVKPHEFNPATIRRSLRTVTKTYNSLYRLIEQRKNANS
jgi:hypothetical protein